MRYVPPSDIDPVARGVIRRKLRTLSSAPRWAAPGDRDDIAQELALHAHVIARKFNPARGDPEAFFEVAMTRRIRDLVSRANAECRDWRRSVPLTEPTTVRCPSARRREIQIDVRHALAVAPPPLKRLAVELSRDSLARAARACGLSRQQARHQRELLAEHFTACGLDPRSSSN